MSHNIRPSEEGRSLDRKRRERTSQLLFCFTLFVLLYIYVDEVIGYIYIYIDIDR